MSVYELMRPNIQRLEPYKCARDEAGPDMDVYLDAKCLAYLHPSARSATVLTS